MQRRLLYASLDHSASSAVRLTNVVGAAWYVAPVSGGQPVRIEPSAQFSHFLEAFPVPLAWLGSNRILFSYTSGDSINLWMATLSPDNRRIIGPPKQLTFGTGRVTDVSISGNGTVVFATTEGRPRLWNAPLLTRQASDKGDPMAVATNRDFTTYPSLSDTGKLAYLARTSDKWNLWLRDLPSGKETLLTTLLGNIYSVSAYLNRTGTRWPIVHCRDQSRLSTRSRPEEGRLKRSARTAGNSDRGRPTAESCSHRKVYSKTRSS